MRSANRTMPPSAVRAGTSTFHGWARDWQMAKTLLVFEHAGFLREKHRAYSGPDESGRVVSIIYSVHLPEHDDFTLPVLPDVTGYCLDYEDGPIDKLQ